MNSYSINLKTSNGSDPDSDYQVIIPVYQINRKLPFYEKSSHRYYYLKRNDEGKINFHNNRYYIECVIHDNENDYLNAQQKFVTNNQYEFFFFVTIEDVWRTNDLKDITFF